MAPWTERRLIAFQAVRALNNRKPGSGKEFAGLSMNIEDGN